MDEREDVSELRTTVGPVSVPRKARLKKPKFPFVLVLWNDAWSENSDINESEIDPTPQLFYTAGWLVRQTEAGINIASEWAPNENKWRHVTFIPSGMVVDIIKK